MMRPHITAFFRQCANLLPCQDPIVEIAACQRADQKGIDLQSCFSGKPHVRCGLRTGPGVDRVEDIYALRFEDGEVGTFLLPNTLEQVLHPFRAFDELYRCLSEDGVLIFTSGMDTPIRACPQDYWRFTPEAVRALARPFASAAIFHGGNVKSPHSVCAVAAKANFDAALLKPLSERLVAIEVADESGPGLLPGDVTPNSGLVLHSFDLGPVEPGRLLGRRLVEYIRGSGEPVIIELGCGSRRHGNLGIDSQVAGTEADIICNVGFEPIPLDDESVDEVFCRHFLEHLPNGVYLERQRKMMYPVINLMNEGWRILKPGGVSTPETPCYPTVEVHQDPTDLSVWTQESMAYSCGKYPIARTYDVKANFELLENRMSGFYLHARLRKPVIA
jgi:hypothetical protein